MEKGGEINEDTQVAAAEIISRNIVSHNVSVYDEDESRLSQGIITIET
jgi:hypothetical protein